MSQPFSHASTGLRPPPAPNLQDNPIDSALNNLAAMQGDDDMDESPNFADSQKQIIITLAQMLHCAESLSSLRSKADSAVWRRIRCTCGV